MKENPFKKTLEELAEKVYSRDDLHKEYKEKMKKIILQFFLDFGDYYKNIPDEEISVECIQDFISAWVELKLKKSQKFPLSS
jgi:hypothetical protein